MAKVASHSDQGLIPTTGKWVWKEESHTLDFVSCNPVDRQDKRRNRGQKAGVHFQDNKQGQNRGATPSLGSRALGLSKGRQSGIAGSRSPKQKHTHVTLGDVKSVAIAMLSEVDVVSSSFEGIYETTQLDEFLMYLLNFFHWFFEKQAHEQKPNPMNIEPSAAEKKEFADLCSKLEMAQKQLGQAYCVLVLGIGLGGQHHMACGASRVSSTYKDRDMYETLYSFCSFVVWITFRRKEYETIRRELGRMLRSDTFNPAIRVKNAPEPELNEEGKEDEKKEKKQETKLTPAEYRRLHGKRPAIKSIINQRSPALVSILPSPKEDAQYLFKRGNQLPLSIIEAAAPRPKNRHTPRFKLSLSRLSSIALPANNRQECAEVSSSKVEQSLEGEDTDGSKGNDGSLNPLLKPSKFVMGIIGEPLSQFNPVTLTPLGAETEEEDAEKDTAGGRRESVMGSSPHGKTPQSGQDPGASRQVTAVSMATTEGMSDDE